MRTWSSLARATPYLSTPAIAFPGAKKLRFDLYAYAPYRETALEAGAVTLPLALAADQQDDAAYTAADLRFSKRTNYAAVTGDVAMEFVHAMSRIDIVLKAGYGYTLDDFASGVTFTALQDERFGRRILEAFAVRRNFDERFACCGILWNDDGRQSLQTIVTDVTVTDWLPGGEESMNGEEILPPTGTTVEDGDGNSYGIIRIGRQYWMDENLHTTKYNDGTAIAHITDGKEWMAAIEGAYCSYGNVDANAARYGLLYNRAAVSTHKLCPEGWHVPTVDDWNKLGSALGGTLNDFDSWVGIASKLKATAGWPAGEKATDESGFGGLPGGAFRADPNDTATAKFYYAETNGYWWSDSDFSGEMTYYYGLRTQGDNLDQYVGDRCSGMSVRCVHDF